MYLGKLSAVDLAPTQQYRYAIRSEQRPTEDWASLTLGYGLTSTCCGRTRLARIP